MHKSLLLTVLFVFALSANLFAAELPAAKGKEVIDYLNQSNYQSWQSSPAHLRHVLQRN
jgi:hypothetical protein